MASASLPLGSQRGSRVVNIDSVAIVLSEEEAKHAFLVGQGHAVGVVDDGEEDEGMDHAGTLAC